MKAKDCRLWEQQKEKGYEDDYEETTGALAMAHENCMLAKLSASFSVLSSHLTSTNSHIDFSLGRMEWNGMAFQNPAMIDACKTWEVEKRHMQDPGMSRWRRKEPEEKSLDSRRQTRNIAQYYSPMILSMWPTSQVDISSSNCENSGVKRLPYREKRTRGLFVRRGVDGVGCVVGWQLCVGFLVPIDGCKGCWIAEWSGKSFTEGKVKINMVVHSLSES